MSTTARKFTPAARLVAALAACMILAWTASAAEYRVGPAREHKTLQEIVDRLAPGDLVLVDGDAAYPGDLSFNNSGTAEKPITVRGVRVNGKRPLIEGGTRTVHFNLSNYMIFEGFEVAGGSRNGIYNRAAFTVIRDTLVRDCPAQGILAADNGSGSLTLEYVEVVRSGAGTHTHPIYVSTDPVAYPEAVFRMVHCYVRDGGGGNAVKTRCERNEIYYNCIEGGYYRELEMIGRDAEHSPRPMHSDVVGNLFIKKSSHPVVRIGSDSRDWGSRGRYRFVNNTFVLSLQSKTAIQTYGFLESVEMSNNVFYRRGGATIDILNVDNAQWTTGARVVAGAANWVIDGSRVPPEWSDTIRGLDPGFVSDDDGDFRVAPGSVLIDAGTQLPAGAEGFDFPRALFPPAWLPPASRIEPLGTASPRPVVGTIDVGAFEYVGE